MAKFGFGGGTRSGGNAGKGSPAVRVNRPGGQPQVSRGGVQAQKSPMATTGRTGTMSVRTNSVNPAQGPKAKNAGPLSGPAPVRTPLGFKPGSKPSQPMGTVGGKRAAGTGAKVTPGIGKMGKGLGTPARAGRIGNKS